MEASLASRWLSPRDQSAGIRVVEGEGGLDQVAVGGVGAGVLGGVGIVIGRLEAVAVEVVPERGEDAVRAIAAMAVGAGRGQGREAGREAGLGADQGRIVGAEAAAGATLAHRRDELEAVEEDAEDNWVSKIRNTTIYTT